MANLNKDGQESWKLLFAKLKMGCMDLLFPPVCSACGARLLADDNQASLCPECRQSLQFLHAPLCPICGMELPAPEGSSGHLCGTCLSRKPSYDLARSLVKYEGAVRQLIHALKFGGDTAVSGALADIIRSGDLRPFAECRYILPVPLHGRRLRSRGLNQAAVLARLFFPEREQSIRPDGLIRVRNTRPQTELRGGDRRKNLKNAFELHNSWGVDGAIVCLVDDVFTTGTTVEECSRVLKHHGAKEVRVITLARAGLTRGGLR